MTDLTWPPKSKRQFLLMQKEIGGDHRIGDKFCIGRNVVARTRNKLGVKPLASGRRSETRGSKVFPKQCTGCFQWLAEEFFYLRLDSSKCKECRRAYQRGLMAKRDMEDWCPEQGVMVDERIAKMFGGRRFEDVGA